LKPFCFFSSRRTSEAVKASSAEAMVLALLASTRVPQYGQVRDFLSSAIRSKPLHLGHSMMFVCLIFVCLFRKTFPHTVR
jgi:hypothetical protein